MSSIALTAVLRRRSPLIARALYNSPLTNLSFSRATPYTSCLRFQSTSSKAQNISEEVRSKLTNEPEAKIYTYEDIKKLITSPDPSKVLVDVREPSEFQEYAIPTSINIPYKSTPGALDLTPEEFEDIFKFEKPSKEKELIFYCVAGVRSTAAADLAQIFGYQHLGNYVGSLEDWLAHEQPEPVKQEQSETKTKTQTGTETGSKPSKQEN